jgi:Icc-related predicted phosphoesterase
MKILAVSDQVEERLYSPLLKKTFGDVDILVSCGDLPYNYLEYMLSALNVPMVYVPGNHDPVIKDTDPSSWLEGGTHIDLKLVKIKGLYIAGVGGSIRYRPNGVNQYTQNEMFWRIYPMLPKLLLHRALKRPLDLLVTHSSPAGIHDDDDEAHKGLRAINLLVKWFKPRYLLHGHTYFYRRNLVSPITEIDNTKVINILPYHLLEI